MSPLGHPRFLASSRCALLCACLLATLVSVAHADPENFSGLKDKDLTPKSGSSLDVGGKLKKFGLDRILGGIVQGQNKGTIASTHVLSDRASSLTVQVFYSDLQTDADRTLSISATDEKGRPLRALQTAKTSIQGTQGDATLTLQFSPDADVVTGVKQAALRVQISRGDSLKPDVLAEFECPKQWRKAPSTIVAKPIGKSVGLPATQPATQPVTGGRFRSMTRLRIRPATTFAADSVVVRMQSPTLAASATSIKIATANDGTVQAVNPNLALLGSAQGAMGLPTAVKDNNGQGPGSNYLRIFDGVEMEAGVSERGVTSLHPNIYEDGNPASGFFYYLPAGYSLYWDADSGYALRVLYGAATGDATDNVSIAARLTTGITNSDVALARTILQDYCRTNNRVFKELKPFPFSSMAILLKNSVGSQYNIPPEKINVTGITDIAGLIDFSLVTDSVTKENLQLVMTQGLGISGQVTYQSASQGADALQITIPLRLKFGDRDSFGDRPYNRNGVFKNATPFTQKLKTINVLTDVPNAAVYSYDLGDAEIPPGGQASIDASEIRTWLDASAKRMWIDYSVVSDDAQANKKAWDGVTGGVTSASQSEITFRTLTPLEDTGAALVVVTVASKYFDPRGGAEATKTIELGKDNGSFKLKPVYLVGRQAGENKPGDPLFKFKLTVVKADGTSVESEQWTNSNGLTIYIGKAQVQPLLGTPPAAPVDDPKTPDAPVNPDPPATPDAPANPGVAKTPGAPKTPGAAKTAGAPKTPKTPAKPGAPKAPDKPEDGGA